MIGLDTNVLLRLRLIDDTGQFERVQRHIQSGAWADGAVVNLVVLVEALWVLTKQLKRPKPEIIVFVERLLATDGIVVLNEDAVTRALDVFRTAKCDFADCLIAELNVEVGARPTFSFDADALTLPNFAPLPA